MKRPRLAVALGVLVLLVLGAELGVRAVVSREMRYALENFRRYLLTGEMRGYEPRAYTVFQRPRGGPPWNAFGFSDGSWSRERTPGVPRILCLGGSTTEGGNESGRLGAYPYLLERTLQERTGRDFEVYNAGISGWTTAEMLVSWFLTLQDLRPDVLVIHEAVNDCEPRFRAGFEPDYSHWRKPVQLAPARGIERVLARTSLLYSYLRLRAGRAPHVLDVCTDRDAPFEPLMKEDRLPPETSLPFRRNVRTIARSAAADGAVVVLMTQPDGSKPCREFWRYCMREHNEHLRELCREHGFVLADAEQVFAARPELEAEFSDLVHLEPAGNQAKAEIVADALAAWLATLSPEGARPPVQEPFPKKHAPRQSD
jgi:lysophospholipase L1-like esterase